MTGIRECSVGGCARSDKMSHGYCSMHYKRWRRTGDPLEGGRKVTLVCEIEGCGLPHAARGLCCNHYGHLMRKGHPLAPDGRAARTRGNQERFYGSVDRNGPMPDFSDPLVRLTPDDGRCWAWTGGFRKNGYANFYHNAKAEDALCGMGSGSKLGHRISYMIFRGDPGKFVIDHLCRNRGCVNPDHLEAITQRENILRGAHANH